jgi:hypothetical protein
VALRVVNLGQDASAPLGIERALLRQPHGARRTAEHRQPKLCFEERHRAGSRGRRQTQLPRGTREAAQVGHGDEGAHRVEAVHALFHPLKQ